MVKVNPVEDVSALAQIVGAEVDMQVSTAKRYPRQLGVVMDKALSMATRSEDIAADCFYVLPRGARKISGPSIRLAEIMVSCWGNLRGEMRTLGADDNHVEGQAMVWDLETNVAIRKEEKRRITHSDGRRYNDDMIATTGRAAAAIAFREAAFKVIPRVYVDEIYDACRKVAVGNIKTLGQQRTKALDHFHRYGITDDRILAVLERASIEEVTLDDVETLRGIRTAIKDKQIKPDEAFPELEKREKGTKGLMNRLGAKQPDRKPEPEPEEPGLPSDEEIEAAEARASREE